MGFIKGILGFLLVLVILIVGAALILPQVIDPNDYRDDVAALVKEKTGRDMVIEGPVSLSLYPSVALQLDKVTLGNTEGFGESAFASIDTLFLKVKLRPLFDERVEVEAILLDGLVLNLSRNTAGTNNWDDLRSPKSASKNSKVPGAQRISSTSQSASSVSATRKEDLDFQGLRIRNAQVTWDDQRGGVQYQVSDISITAERLVPGERAPVEGKLIVSSRDSQLTTLIGFSGDVLVQEINKNQQQFSIADLQLVIDATGEELPDGKMQIKVGTDLDVDLVADTLAARNLKITGKQIAIDGEIKGTKLRGDFDLAGILHLHETSLRELLALVDIQLETADAEVLSRLSGSAAFLATGSSLRLDPLKLKLDDSNLHGVIDVSSFDGPILTADLTLDALDLDRYLPPPTEEQLMVRELGYTQDMEKSHSFPVAESLDLAATLKVSDLKFRDVQLHNAVVNMTSSKGVMFVDPLSSASD